MAPARERGGRRSEYIPLAPIHNSCSATPRAWSPAHCGTDSYGQGTRERSSCCFLQRRLAGHAAHARGSKRRSESNSPCPSLSVVSASWSSSSPWCCSSSRCAHTRPRPPCARRNPPCCRPGLVSLSRAVHHTAFGTTTFC